MVLAALAAGVLGVGAVADRALVAQADLARDEALEGLAEEARLAALSVRAALAQVEQELVAGVPVPGVVVERLVPRRSARPPRTAGPAYRRLSRSELVALLSSDGTTGNGLPEAAVAAVALGEPAALTAALDRLVQGDLPVVPEDVPFLLEALGAPDHPRREELLARLAHAPTADGVPRLPAFTRRLVDGVSVEGWSRDGERLIRYRLSPSLLLDRAELARASVGDTPLGGDARTVPVPEVAGLELTVPLEVPAELRLRMLRAALWLGIAASLAALVALWRAHAREVRAAARERSFVAAVTHELRTPLASLRLFGETLAAGRGNPAEYGRLIAGESERLEELVENALAAARSDEALRPAPCRPADILASVVELVRDRAAGRGMTLEATSGAGLPEVLWDAGAVRRALLNLVDNAIRHGREGGRVEVGAAADGDVVRLTVRDDGPGIRPRDRRRLFGRFARGSLASSRTGLGLHLVESVARAHGGRVDLETEPGRGCTFSLVLPRSAGP